MVSARRRVAWQFVFWTGLACFLVSLPLILLVRHWVGLVIFGVSLMNLGILDLMEKRWPEMFGRLDSADADNGETDPTRG
jgi:hypothetical protein